MCAVANGAKYYLVFLQLFHIKCPHANVFMDAGAHMWVISHLPTIDKRGTPSRKAPRPRAPTERRTLFCRAFGKHPPYVGLFMCGAIKPKVCQRGPAGPFGVIKYMRF